MSQKNDTLPLVLSLVITLALLGAGLWWFGSRLNWGGGLPSAGDDAPGATGNSTSSVPVAADDRLSRGERLLFPESASPQKQAGVAGIAATDFEQAVESLEASLQAYPNDPEALIYKNNAAIGTAKSYTIAAAVPIGSDANAALEMLRGVAQAQDEMNRGGGIDGVPLKVLIANDDDSPETAKAVAQAFVDDREVLGVVGHYASDVTLAAAEVYEAGKLVTISPVSTSVKLSGFGSYTFRTVPSDYVAARALANYMLSELQQQNAAVFYNSESGYSQSLKSEFSTALALGGGQITNEFDLSDSGLSAARSVAQATEQGATVLVLLPNSGRLDRALQVVTVNQRQLSLLAGDDVYSPKTLEIGGAEAIGMVVAVPWHILSNPQSEFVTDSRNLWGGDVNWRTAMAYDAAQALIAALQRNPTRQGVQQALSAADFSATGATGAVRFLPSGDRNQSVQLVTVEPGSRSGYGYDFVPIP
jgi:branched-chain amino acid transport system substrate-binding protein